MERPGWVIVVGVIGMIIGFFSILGAGKSIVMPTVIEFQKKVLTRVEEVYEKAEVEKDLKAKEELPPKEILEIGADLLNLPAWFYKWSIIFGLIGVPVSAFYLFSSIWLFLMKKLAVRLFYVAIGLSICLAFSRTIVAIASKSFIGFFFLAGSSFWLAVNIVLLLVVILSDKKAFAVSKVKTKLKRKKA